MGKIPFIVVVLLASLSLQAQHKIVYDLSTADTAQQSIVLRQFNNVLNPAPGTQLELVVHGYAVFMLVKDKAYFEKEMNALKARGNVTFKICANAMKRFGVKAEDLIPLAEIVPVAILELADKQQQGWIYIKAG